MNDKIKEINLKEKKPVNTNQNLIELLNEYIIENDLGQGNFGKVKLATHKATKEKVI
jgi:serine/threonine protein kinase